jgi:transcriptional regulator with XRE-family HTH domain
VEVGGRLLAVRIQQGLSLAAVQEKSAGQFSAAAVGSYERADRQLSPERLSELARFYGVPVSVLLPTEPARVAPVERVVIDLPALAEAGADAAVLRRWIRRIQEVRGDWAGRVLSIRGGDVRALAVLHDMPMSEFLELLDRWGVRAR